MIEAGVELLAGGEDRIGFLFTVGEETDSLGAQVANQRLAEPWAPRHTIVGEPTGNRFVSGHKGIFKARLEARGVAGHSSEPQGPSAIHELVQVLERLLREDWGRHPRLGAGTLNVGEISGGVAANVVADRAGAALLLRAVEAPATTEEKLRRHLGPHVHLDCLYKRLRPDGVPGARGPGLGSRGLRHRRAAPAALGSAPARGTGPHRGRPHRPRVHREARRGGRHRHLRAHRAAPVREGRGAMSERARGAALLDQLESGALRVAERGADGTWIVHAWIKEEILALFRASQVALQGASGASPLGDFLDKEAFPVRRLSLADRVRLVPGGSAVRRGAHLAPGVICMPPMYVNVGAFVGANTMVDSHAPGGFLRPDRRARAPFGRGQIGGVLEPAGGRPVIVEGRVLRRRRRGDLRGRPGAPPGGARRGRDPDRVNPDP
jgi:hypothetical protein